MPDTCDHHELTLLQSSKTLAQPLIGGSGAKREGPWPECVGVTGQICQGWIEDYTPSETRVEVLEEGMPITKEFSPERVRIWISAETGLVNRIPRRG